MTLLQKGKRQRDLFSAWQEIVIESLRMACKSLFSTSLHRKNLFSAVNERWQIKSFIIVRSAQVPSLLSTCDNFFSCLREVIFTAQSLEQVLFLFFYGWFPLNHFRTMTKIQANIITRKCYVITFSKERNTSRLIAYVL